MSKKQKITRSSWFEKFYCTGGDCPLTCCVPGKWAVSLNQEDLNRLDDIAEPYRTKVIEAIDLEKGCFKSKEQVYGDTSKDRDKCALLEKNGLCSLVLKCGEQYLCDTCDLFPRRGRFMNDYLDYSVLFACPVVAEFLFDNEELSFNEYEIEKVTDTDSISGDEYDSLRTSMEFLINLFNSINGYEAGKCFIFFETLNGIQSFMDAGLPIKPNTKNLLSKYLSQEAFAATLSECEAFNEDIVKKAAMIQLVFRLSGFLFDIIIEESEGMLSCLKKDMEIWKADNTILGKDLEEFYDYRKSHFPKMVDKYMASVIFSYWIGNPKDKFASTMKLYYYLLLLVQICMMSYRKTHKKTVSSREYGTIIANVFRKVIFNQGMVKGISDSIEEIEKTINFSIFLLPAY